MILPFSATIVSASRIGFSSGGGSGPTAGLFRGEGLPVGLQIVGRYGRDAEVLALARAFEARVHKAAEQGAKVLYNPGRRGALLPPITVDFVPHKSELVFEETFGPVAAVMVVADACYSGTLLRDSNARMDTSRDRNVWLKRILGKRARTVLSSVDSSAFFSSARCL